MSNLFRAVLLLGFLLTTNATAADPKTEIEAVLGDLNAVRSYYHRDFVLVTAEGILSAGQRLGDLEAIMEPGKDHGELSFSELQVKLLGDEHVMAYGRSSLKFSDGTELNSLFTTVYVKTPFGWKAILTHD
jgi:ketosteroid isomerase-like protein